ncbi:MAG TPA: serine/threonine-protein kinase, partial [Pseudomonadota bacterium]|nr:serine/threonine-protein kinase [Pseudomonadota bacterium]
MSNLPTIAGRYQLQREIGRGGAGVVYAVKHLHTGERLAMKVLLSHAANQPDLVHRFRREMQASARVRSEHVVRVTDADLAPELQGVPFLIMELLSGIDLARLLSERGACTQEEALWLLGQAARGLDRAHGAGIVHRDLKPENMFLHKCDDGRLIVKLLDFGVARMTDGSGLSSAEARVTQDGAILGTPLFLTPEQALGETDKIGPTTDVWPVGLIAHELLTGVSYWSEEQMTTLLAKIIFKPLAPPSSKGTKLGTAFDDWFLRSCAREPGQRWPSVGAQVEALADALGVDR